MKKMAFLSLFFLMSAVVLIIPQQDQEVIEEKVELVKIKVPIRVYYKGKPVHDLKKG